MNRMVSLLEKSPLPPKTALRARGYILHLVAPVLTRRNSSNRTEFRRFTYETCFRLETCARDPIGYEDGFNVYAYVQCSPMRFVDPSGFAIVTFPDRPPEGRASKREHSAAAI
jgi:hypothetical protein